MDFMFKHNYRWVVIVWLIVIGAIAYFDRVNFSIAAPGLSKDLGLNPAQLGIVMSAFGIGYLLSNFPGSIIMSKYTAYKILTVILVFWSAMTFFTGFAWSFASMLVIRILFGIFEGPLIPGSFKIIGNWTLPKDRGFTTGVYAAFLPAGIVIGNLISVAVVSTWGWRMVFYTFGVLGVIIGLLTWIIIKDRPTDSKLVSQEELDLIKTSMAKYDGKVSSAGRSKLSELLANPWSWVMTLNYFCITLALWANLNWLPTYFIKARGTSLVGAGMNASVPWVAMLIGMIFMGWIADKVGEKYKSTWNAFSLFLMVPATAYAVITPSITTCLICFSISLFGVGGALGLINAINLDISKKEDVPLISGMMVTGASVSGIIAPMLIGFVLKETNSFNIAYYVFSIFAFIGGITGVMLFSREKKLRTIRAGSL
jgi:sugar phosphate permease